jgi:hypothetical protein
MNIVGSLVRAAVASAVATATAVASPICAGANPPPADAAPWTVIASRELDVRCAQNGQCPPQVIPFTTQEGVLWFDTMVIGSMSCGAAPRLQVSTGGFPPSDSLNPLTTDPAIGNQTLTITSRCDAGGLVQGSWTGIAKVWYQPDSGFTIHKPAAAHTITGDVDLYDKPGGHGKKIGILRKGDAVTLNGPCPIQSQGDTNGWCLVNDTTQNKSGAVWGDFVSK